MTIEVWSQVIPTGLYYLSTLLDRLILTMLLVQKPLTLTPSQSPLYAHRRHPSAPSTVVVHSTRTPGLLTLSKPPRPPLQRQSQRQTPKRLPNSKSAPGIRATLLNSAEITDSKTSVIALPTTPSPQPRGRGQIKHPKDKVQVQRWSFFIFLFLSLGADNSTGVHPSLLGVENVDVNLLPPSRNHNHIFLTISSTTIRPPHAIPPLEFHQTIGNLTQLRLRPLHYTQRQFTFQLLHDAKRLMSLALNPPFLPFVNALVPFQCFLPLYSTFPSVTT